MLFDRYRILLAPMAGITDQWFRQLCIEQGAQLTYTEMVSAKGLSYANEKTADLLELAPNEQHVVVQLFGHEPEVMAKQAQWLEQRLGKALFAIDINMGCPARKIMRKGDGSALMGEPELAQRIVYDVACAVSTPVTVKFRRGISSDRGNAIDFAKRMEQAGAQAVCVHPRFAEQFYSGSAEWSVIAQVKDAVTIPVVGSGDITSGAKAKQMRDRTVCDAVMIGRAAMGNPWIFADVLSVLTTGSSALPPTPEERIALAKRHVRLFAEGQRGSGRAVRLSAMRRHAMCYVSGMPGASEVRALLSKASTIEDYDAAFDRLFMAQRKA